MLEDIIIIGIVMAVTQFGLKRLLKGSSLDDEERARLTALFVLALAGLAQVANAAVFEPGASLIEALAEGIRLGAIAGGVYSLGKAALGVE